MDSGLAAVLGATVGALGTGGAAVVAAMFARSQLRMQIRAEHRRSLRDPRKAAYVAFAECWRNRLELTSSSWIELQLAADNRESPEFRGLLEAASTYREQADSLSTALEHAQAVVYVEGPRAVTAASNEASGKLTTYRRKVHDAFVAVQRGEPIDAALLEVGNEARDAAYRAYLRFLRAASDVLGDDVL
ncbi:hypothetical protein [Streptomyces sp. NPDC006668]|uniref:hypothetical protein n=1 Tax=Streptomyces sp. NPDC006668 TaxID=3156903 RepID=UPI00340E43B5